MTKISGTTTSLFDLNPLFAPKAINETTLFWLSAPPQPWATSMEEKCG